MSWWSRLTNALHSRRLDDELAEELEQHLDRRVDDFVRQGLTPAEARLRARREFGDVSRLHEEAREAHVLTTLETGVLDVRHAIRSWRRRPLAVATIVVSIGAATGAAIAVYSLINASILKPLPVPNPDELVALSVGGQAGATPAPGDDPGLFSYPLYESLRTAAGEAAQLTMLDDPRPAEVEDPGGEGRSDRAVSQFVGPDFFRVLRIATVIGRDFESDVDTSPAPLEVILSHDYWARRFGADAAVVGRSLTVDGRPHVILGIAAAGFRGAERGIFVDLWRSVRTFDQGAIRNPGFRSFRLMGRLSPGVPRRALYAPLDTAFRQFQQERISIQPSLPPSALARLQSETLLVESGRTGASSEHQTSATPLWIVFGLTSAILLVASANVAGLILARASARQHEITLRLTLGASRLRIFRLFVLDGGLLALTGTGLGVAIAPLLARALLLNLTGGDHPLQLDLTTDVRVWGFAASVAVLSALIIGVIPAWRVIATKNRTSSLHLGRQIIHGTASRGLVAVQIAFSFSLVMSGAAFVISLQRLTAVPLGFDARDVAVFTMANDAGPTQRPLQLQLMHDLESRVSAHSKVDGAAAAWWALFSDAKRTQRVSLPGGALADAQEVFYRVSPHYFGTLHVPLLSGRNFTAADNDDEPVHAVISRAFAMKYFGIESPLGRIFVRDDGVRHEVVGVAGDSRYDSLRDGAVPIVYMPMKPTGVFTFYVRGAHAAGDLSAIVSAEAKTLGFRMRIRDTTTLGALVDQAVAVERLLAQIGGACALLGLGLAALGLFGLLNYAVASRTAEIGLRSMLGASRGRIATLVLGDVAWPVGAGVCAGAVASFVAIRAMGSMLFDLEPTSPAVVGGALATFALTAVAACLGPVWRAAVIDPAIALRRQ